MSITPERKAALITEYATKPGDTGSPEVQVAILTDRIKTLTEHFQTNKERQPFTPRAFGHGRETPSSFGLSEEKR